LSKRTSERIVTLHRPFVLGEDTYPPGEYLVQTDEVTIDQLSFPAWRRVATMIHVRNGGTTQVLTVAPQELELILSADVEGGPSDGSSR